MYLIKQILLESIHLGVPSVMALLRALKKNGLDVDTHALNVDEACKLIEAALEKKGGPINA